MMSMLVKAGQDPELEDSYGQTPLHLAALRGNLDAAEYLVMEVKCLRPGIMYLLYSMEMCLVSLWFEAGTGKRRRARGKYFFLSA